MTARPDERNKIKLAPIKQALESLTHTTTRVRARASCMVDFGNVCVAQVVGEQLSPCCIARKYTRSGAREQPDMRLRSGRKSSRRRVIVLDAVRPRQGFLNGLDEKFSLLRRLLQAPSQSAGIDNPSSEQ